MNLKVRDWLFPHGFWALLGGGALGAAASFLPWPWVLGLGAFLLGAVFFFQSFLSSRRQAGVLRQLSENFPGSALVDEILTSSAGEVLPLESALKKSLEKIRELEQRSDSLPQKVEIPFRELSESIEELFRSQEKAYHDFHVFKDVIHDWSSSIEKAGRINKSLLQLNELIVNDSKKVASDTEAAAHSATDGIKSVGKEIKAMTEIKATIGSSTEVIQQLSRASEQIGDFLATITAIARKTNLLALNAGIEAARAGEHGQGFAVVASEIKTLAEASAKASGDVKHLVDDIRSKTASAISLISTTGKIEENVNVVYSAGDVFMNIVKSVRKAGGLLGEISQALDDQRNDNELLVQLINKVYQAGDQVKVRFDQVEQSLEEVQKLSEKMKTAVENLKN